MRTAIERTLLERLVAAHERTPAGDPAIRGIEVLDTVTERPVLDSFVARGRASRRGRTYYLSVEQLGYARERLIKLG